MEIKIKQGKHCNKEIQRVRVAKVIDGKYNVNT